MKWIIGRIRRLDALDIVYITLAIAIATLNIIALEYALYVTFDAPR